MDFEAWKNDVAEQGTTPEGAITSLVEAFCLLSDDPTLARAVITLLVHKDECVADLRSPSGQKPGSSLEFYLDQLVQHPQIAPSYLGGTPNNGYVRQEGAALRSLRTDTTERKVELRVQSGGKDNATPMTCRRNRAGQWKVTGGIGSMVTGVRPIQDDDF